MKLWTPTTLWTVSLLILSGCATTPKPKDVVVDSTLPVVSLTKSGIIIDMKSIAFEWDTIKDSRVDGVYVYRKIHNQEPESELAHFDTVENRFKTHYVDSQVMPDVKYSYQFKTYAEEAQSKNSSMVTVNSLPVLQSVSWIHSITGMPRTAKIIWRPHVNQKVKSYIIERKTLEEETWSELALINGRLNAEYIDEDLNDNYTYMYRIKVLTYDDIVSSPSQIVKVLTKALPVSINSINTTINLPKRIQIDWNKSTQADFALYYLYKSHTINGKYELIATLHNNTFIDKIEEDGKSYFYRVSVVDRDGLESLHDELTVSGMTLQKPLAPAIVESKLLNSKIVLEWKSSDARSKSYVITKKHKKGWFKESEEEIAGLIGTKYVDTNIESDSTYIYTLSSVDKYNIKSDPSIETVLVTPESTILEVPDVKKAQEEILIEPVSQNIEAESKDIISVSQDLDLSGL